ncbi:DEAD/DEAH box helicase family protein [Granulicella cerasi]|uniref:DEAD/DEAH box helicase family protein n=1 Tax=Granulicella cerasi TaxID=741063 RepID=A0ABW1Z596_9BACT|nr:DEAD/DEAH box helicase family protein [Granulicella cerasi]
MSTNFGFLQNEWPQIYESAVKAESFAIPDPGTACFHARRTLELVMHWLYESDSRLRLPYQDNLDALIHEPTFVNVAGSRIQTKAQLIKSIGNRAVHADRRVTSKDDSLNAVRELFHVTFWMARTYARGAKPADTLQFLPVLLPATSPVPPATKAKLRELESTLAEKDAKLAELITGQAAMDAELQQLRAEVAEARKRNEAAADTHDYNEAETRDAFIDMLLAEAGWSGFQHGRDIEYEVSGMPSDSGVGFVDYVLWGKDGKPLALVEAKRTRKSPLVGQQQAKLYADCLEAKFGQRPVIFYTNGYEHWIWDDLQHPPREVSGFYTHDELELLVQRRQTRKPLSAVEIDSSIVERYYQTRAIRKVAERFATDKQRKSLLVMATGSGKTRTVIALCDLLMKAGWVKRVLFLADRVALVKQAANAFKEHLPASSPVNLVSEKSESGRVYISTYPTMMNLIDHKREDGTRRFGTGYFDLIVVDEAHRSIYQKYGAIFDYFDSYLVGLTATPKDEVDRNTYRLFALEDGVPTDEYSLDDAIKDKFLVPPKAVSVPLKFQREGIKYNELSEEEKDQWDALEWDEEGEVPDQVNAADVNNWLFNRDTVDKVLQHLMEKGEKVAGRERLGKTIIFAKNHEHAEFIAKRFDENYPEYAGHFARVIDFKVTYAQSLIDNFSQPEKAPHIAISVDMLDTGIDVPEVVNLVFFKLVRSKTKFWQMVGRGTRLSRDLFAPGKDKQFFYIFDFCQNLEFFSQSPETTNGSTADSLSKKLFINRLDLLAAIENVLAHEIPENLEAERALRADIAARLQREVAAMTLENFLVRPHRRLVELFANPEAWESLTEEDRTALSREVAGLPSALPTETPEAKQFDLLMLRMQLTLLRGEPGFERMRENVQTIARLLESQVAIPAVAAKLILIQEIQSSPFWEDVNVVALEQVRKGLRDLVQFIERRRRATVITDFEDEIREGSTIALPGTSIGVDMDKVRDKAQAFLRKHENDPVLHKLRFNEALTPEDLEELERIFTAEGSTLEEIDAVKKETQSLGLFVRSLVGLDREAAKMALSQFTQSGTLTANQMEFVNLIVNHLATRGVIELGRLYESPFTDVHSSGLDGLFKEESTLALLTALKAVRQNAMGMPN